MSTRAIKIVRIAGACLIASMATAAGWCSLKSGDGAEPAAFGVDSFREVITPGAGEKFVPHLKNEPDARWGGCALIGAKAGPHKYLFSLKCPDGGRVTVSLDPLFASEGYRPEVGGGRACCDGQVLVKNLTALVRQVSVDGATAKERARPYQNLPVLIAIFIAWYLAELGWWRLSGRLRQTQRSKAVPAVVQPVGLPGPLTGRTGVYGGIVPLMLLLGAATVVRLGLAHPGLSEVMSFFQTAPVFEASPDKHSTLYDLVKALLQACGLDPLTGLIAFNSVAGILTAIPMYVFIKRRAGDGLTAFFAVLLFAVHPVIARMSATDAHHSLLMLFWCSGMAVLSVEKPGPARVFCGMVLLGAASVMRIEGIIYFISSIFMLWPDALGRLWRHRVSLLAGFVVVVAMVVDQYLTRMGAWGMEFFFLRDASGGMDRLVSALGNLAGFLVYSLKPLGPVWVPLTMAAFAGCIRSVPDRSHRWMIGVFASWVMTATVCSPRFETTLPAYIHRAVPVYMLQCIMFGAGASWLLKLVPSGGKRAAVVVAAAVMTAVAVPASNLGYLRGETALSAEYDLLRLIGESGVGGGRSCAVLYFSAEGDLGVNNPQSLASRHRFMDCKDLNGCIEEASRGGCVFYMRNTQCLSVERPPGDASGGGAPLNKSCRRIEESLELEPVKEIQINIRETYGDSPRFPVDGVMGLYRVLGRK